MIKLVNQAREKSQGRVLPKRTPQGTFRKSVDEKAHLNEISRGSKGGLGASG